MLKLFSGLFVLLLSASAWALPADTGFVSQQHLTGIPQTLWPNVPGEGFHTYRVSVTTSTAIYDPPGNLCIIVYHYNEFGEGATAGIDPVNLKLSGAQSFSETLHTGPDGEFIVLAPSGSWPGCQPNSFPGPYDYTVVVEKVL